MRSNVNHQALAKKIADIFSDARLTKSDLDIIALTSVMLCRESTVMENVDLFYERFSTHRYSIDFGRDDSLNIEVKDLFSDTFPDRIEA